ncbi:hypothetical protein FE257_004257 [Aspergillus nanangensis]|uniref:Cytochrome P450 n=1 Tax=Aspergillus nanangensis TaxID=2582783 RepID=A0AAD4GW22_ASPNN|nr:hypothetical protein FE257_004257 [Aspergillus nanangensis]
MSLILSIILIALPTSYVIYHRIFSPLASIPGPISASLSRLWLVKHTKQGDMHREILKLHAQHGKLVRTGPNEVSVTDLNAIKKIYGAGSKFRKSAWYGVFQGHRKFDLFAEQDEAIHGAQRRLVSRIYAMDSLKDLEHYVDGAVAVFVDKMRGLQEQSIDLGEWLQLFAFDVIGELTFSRRFGFMDAHQDDGVFTQIKNALKSGTWLGQMPWIYWVHDFLMPVIGNYLGVNVRHGRLRDYTVQEVQARQNRGSDHQDILGKLFQVQQEKPSELSLADVTSMAASNINAGSDTTAISLRAIVYYLLKHPEYKTKLVEEVDSMSQNGVVSGIVSLEQSKSMPYLQAVMYEALRLHPAVGMNLPRVTPAGGISIDGHFMPEGTTIGANPWAVHRNKTVYGADADAFRPDRWLKDESGDMRMRTFLGSIFFRVRGGCKDVLGQEHKLDGNVQMQQKLIPTLLSHFDLQLTDPEATWQEECNFFVMQSGLYVTLCPRK